MASKTDLLILGLAASVALKTAESASTTSSRRKISVDEIHDLVNSIISDRLGDELQCPLEEYWNGDKCDDCGKVCQLHNINRNCLYHCPVHVLTLIEEEDHKEEWYISLTAICMSAVVLLLMLGFIIHKFRCQTRKYENNSNEVSEESLASQTTSLLPPDGSNNTSAQSTPNIAARNQNINIDIDARIEGVVNVPIVEPTQAALQEADDINDDGSENPAISPDAVRLQPGITESGNYVIPDTNEYEE